MGKNEMGWPPDWGRCNVGVEWGGSPAFRPERGDAPQGRSSVSGVDPQEKAI